MIIEYSNAVPPKGQSVISVAIVVATCAFFFIPTSLIVLGYLSSQPTGTLISPLPQGTMSQAPMFPTATPTPLAMTTPAPAPTETAPLIAAPTDSTSSAESNINAEIANNIIDKSASISANLTEVSVTDTDIKTTSQVYLSPRPGDKAIYSVKSKQDGGMVLSVNTASDTVRYIDYHIVNP